MSEDLVSLPLDMLLTDEPYRERIAAKRSFDVAAGLKSVVPSNQPIEIEEAARLDRAKAAVHRQDIGLKVGPDAIQSRLFNFERTADPTGQTPVGMSVEERQRRVSALASDERFVRFVEQNPEANFYGADDSTFFEGAAQLMRDVIDKPAVVAGALQRSRLQLEKSRVYEDLFRGAPAWEVAGEISRINKQIAETGGQPKSAFDRRILETLGGMADTMFVDPAIEGAKAARVAVPFAIVGGAAAGAALFGAPTAGVGAAPGAAIGATTAPLVILPSAFAIGAVVSMWRRSTGSAYGDMIEAGEDPDALATKLAAITFGTVETGIEFMGAKFQWNVFGKPLLAKAIPGMLKPAVRKEALAYFANPTRLARAVGWLGAAAKASGAEASEEFFQAVLSPAIGDAVLRAGQGKPLGAILDEVFLQEMGPNAVQGLEEAASVFATMMLTGGLFAPLASYRANKEVSAQEDDAEFFDAWAKTESTSKLIERSPRLAGEFLGILTEGSDRSTVYVDPDILQGALNSEAIPAEEADAVMPEVSKRIQDARDQGRRVAIPAREFATVVSNSKLMPHIRAHLTSVPAGLTPAQRMEAQKKSMQEIGLGDLAEEKDSVLAMQVMLDSSAGEVGMRVAEQLAKTGFRDEKTAETEGMAVRDRVRALAAMVSQATGKLYTPEEVFALYPLNVLSKEQVRAIRAGEVDGSAAGPELAPLSQEEVEEQAKVRVQAANETPATNLPVGRVEEAFLSTVARTGREGLTSSVLADLPGAPKKRGEAVRLTAQELAEENIKLQDAAMSDDEDLSLVKRAAKLAKKMLRVEKEGARSADLESLDADVRPTSFNELVGFVETARREAGGQRDWYKQFGEGIARVVGRANLHEASIIFGITSAQTNTWQNLKNTLRIMIAARKFDPTTDPDGFKREVIRKGPGRLGIKITNAALDKIVEVYQTGTYAGGLKVSNYMTLTRRRADNKFYPFTVQDVHMSRVFGFRFRDWVTSEKTGISTIVDTAQMPSPEAIRYSMLMTEQLAQHFGMAPDEIQALLWFYAKTHLSPRDTKPVSQFTEGSWEEAQFKSQDEIGQIEEMIANGQFDTTTPLNTALGREVDPSFTSDVQADPWSTNEFAAELDALAEARAPTTTVSVNPGQGRGYGFPKSTPLADLVEYQDRVLTAITDADGQIKVLRRLGINHIITKTLGTFDRVEPSLVITYPGESWQTALTASRLLGDAFLQDASITARPDFNGQDFVLRFDRQGGGKISASDVEALYAKVNPTQDPDGVNFTLSPDGLGLTFMDGRRFADGDYTADMFDEFGTKIAAALGDGFYVLSHYAVESNYDGSDIYAGRGAANIATTWVDGAAAGAPDLQSAVVNDLYQPVWREYSAAVERLGFEPKRTVSPLGTPLEVGVNDKQARTKTATKLDILSQLVFHGTAAIFKKFDISFIGTGEGAQAFGWGIYFTTSRGIARFYRDKLSGGWQYKGHPVIAPPTVWGLLRSVHSQNIEGARERIEQIIAHHTLRIYNGATSRDGTMVPIEEDALRRAVGLLVKSDIDKTMRLSADDGYTRIHHITPETRAGNEAALTETERLVAEEMEAFDFDALVKNKGMIAAVHIPDSHDLAIWELPLSKQDPKVREGIIRALREGVPNSTLDFIKRTDARFEQIYELATSEQFTPQGLSESLAANGVLGHSYDAQSISGRRTVDGETATNYVIYDDAAISEIVETLDSAGKQASDGPRAQIALKEKEAYAAVLSASDLTGFQHELAHWYLQQMVVFRQLGLASEQMNADLDTVVRWTGAQSFEHLTRPLVDQMFQGKPDKPHELFARGFEVWLAEGKAPTPEMEGIFFKFKSWVRQAYGGLRQTRELLGVSLTDEIREVYDRLFLIEGAVEEAAGDIAEPLFADRPEGWSDAQWAAYQKMWVRHKSEAFTRVTRRHMPDAKRRMREQLAQAMDMFRQEAEAAVAADPGWAAIEWLKRSEQGQGLDRAGLEEILGTQGPGLIDALLARPAQGTGRRLVVANGMDPEWAAESLGFGSVGDMVESMLQARTVDQHVQERVNREIEGNDQWSEESVTADAEAAAGADREALALAELAALRQMVEGPALDAARTAQASTGAPAAPDAASDVALAEASLAEAVSSGASQQAISDLQALVVNARAQQTAAVEGRKQARVAGQTLRAIEERLRAGILRGRARQLVGDVLAGDLKKQRHAWNTVASAAGKAARKALAARKFADAAVEIERQMMADYAVDEINRTMVESERGWRMLDKLKKGKNLAKLRAPGFDGAAQIVKLMQRYDLSKARRGRPEGQTLFGVKLQKIIVAAQQAEGLQSLAEFVKSAEESHLESISVPDWLMHAESDTRHWSKMPVSEFLGLIDVIRNIETASRQEVKDIRTGEKVAIETAVDQIVSRVEEVNGLRKQGQSSRPNPMSLQSLRDMIRWADAMLLRIVDWIDFAGGDDIQNNTLRRYVFESIDRGEHDYIDGSNELTKPWLAAMDKLDWVRMNREIALPGVDNPGTPNKVRIYEVLMWFLHSGTESNLYRRDEGYAGNEDLKGWTPGVMEQAIQQHLTVEDLKIAQEIWDAFEGLRGRVFEHEFEMTGNRPTALERREFIAHTGQKMNGGYMPAKYWSKYNKRAQALNDKADVEGMFGHNFVKSEVEHGHVKSRAAKYSAPLDTDIGVISQHLDRVIYDLTMRKAVRDTYKIVNHPRFESVIRKTWGPEYVDALKKMVHDAARVKSGKPSDGWRKAEKINSLARSSVIYSGLAYRISTGLIQVTGLAPGFSEVGPHWMAMAIANSTRKGVWGLVREVRAASRVLQHRGITKDRELREMLSRKQDRNSLKARIDANTGILITTADAVVSSIVWDAQRMKSMSQHGDMARAIREADRAIERTQGSSTIAGASQLMRAEGWVRWVTLFGSFTSNIYARTRRAARMAGGLQATEDVDGRAVRRAMPASAAWMIITTIYVPAMLDALIRGEGPPEDDEGEKEWLSWSLKRAVSLLASPVPGVSQLVDGMLFPEKRRFLGKSPASRMLDVPVQMFDELQAVFNEDEQFDAEKLTLLTMQGLTMGRVAPLSQAEIWVDNFWPGEEMGSPRDLIWRKPRDRRE